MNMYSIVGWDPEEGDLFKFNFYERQGAHHAPLGDALKALQKTRRSFPHVDYWLCKDGKIIEGA